MPLRPSICLAFDDGSTLVDVVVWIIAGVAWMAIQIAAARKKKNAAPPAAPPGTGGRPAASPGVGGSPTPDELTEIFRRLGADIPNTPPPAPSPLPPPTPRQAMATKPGPRPAAARPVSPRPMVRPDYRKPAGRVAPELARRLARVKQEAEQAARRAEAERLAAETAANAIVPGVQSRAGEHRALDTATRHTGMVLPRLYAMGLRLAPLPAVPLPGFDRSHHAGPPLRARLRTRRELRDAIVAQVFLRPPKAGAP